MTSDLALRAPAELYRALGDIPGAVVDPHAVDVAGRHGVAFTLSKPVALGVIPEIIVNPRSYQLMADEILIPRPGQAWAPRARPSSGACWFPAWRQAVGRGLARRVANGYALRETRCGCPAAPIRMAS